MSVQPPFEAPPGQHRRDPVHPDEQVGGVERFGRGVGGGFRSAGRGLAAGGRAIRTTGQVLAETAGDVWRRVKPALDWLVEFTRPVRRHLAPLARAVGVLGWLVLVGGLAAWAVGGYLGWQELLFVAGVLLIAFVLCALLTIGRTNLNVSVDLSPNRVVAGSAAAGRVLMHNLSRARLLPLLLELPVGVSTARFNLPSLGGGGAHEELFVVPTVRRGVIPVGPASTVRGDPFGMLRRSITWTERLELFVHPVTVPLQSLGSGLLRDLEGQTTQDVSMSDLAFHTLRDYAPGDDRRYIHWRSTAKIGAIGGEDESRFLVRQFLDTRRTHLTIVVDAQLTSYRDEAELELAISVAASITLRAIHDEIDTTVVVGDHAANVDNAQVTMDNFARAEAGGEWLGSLAGRAVRMAPDTSVALMITGPNTGFTELQLAASHFAPEVNLLAMRVDPSTTAGIAPLGVMTVLTLPTLNGLAPLLAGAGLR